MDSQDEGRSPLILACTVGRYETVKFLLDFGVQIKLRENNRVSSVIIASKHGHHEIVKLLLEHDNHKINLQGTEGLLALALAIWNGHSKTVETLLKYGAPISKEFLEYNWLSSSRYSEVRKILKNQLGRCVAVHHMRVTIIILLILQNLMKKNRGI